MKSSPHFHDRLKEDLLREIQWTISNHLRDPRIPAIVSITEVELSPDTRNATVFASVYGTDKEKESAIIALNNAAAFLQKTVAQRISARHFPRFFFKIDNSIEHGLRINQLLNEVKDDLETPTLDTEQ